MAAWWLIPSSLWTGVAALRALSLSALASRLDWEPSGRGWRTLFGDLSWPEAVVTSMVALTLCSCGWRPAALISWALKMPSELL